MSKLTDKQYIEKCGSVCPFCQSDNISGDLPQIDGGTAWQEMVCEDCGKAWNDLYELIGYEEIEE